MFTTSAMTGGVQHNNILQTLKCPKWSMPYKYEQLGKCKLNSLNKHLSNSIPHVTTGHSSTFARTHARAHTHPPTHPPTHTHTHTCNPEIHTIKFNVHVNGLGRVEQPDQPGVDYFVHSYLQQDGVKSINWFT